MNNTAELPDTVPQPNRKPVGSTWDPVQQLFCRHNQYYTWGRQLPSTQWTWTSIGEQPTKEDQETFHRFVPNYQLLWSVNDQNRVTEHYRTAEHERRQLYTRISEQHQASTSQQRLPPARYPLSPPATGAHIVPQDRTQAESISTAFPSNPETFGLSRISSTHSHHRSPITEQENSDQEDLTPPQEPTEQPEQLPEVLIANPGDQTPSAGVTPSAVIASSAVITQNQQPPPPNPVPQAPAIIQPIAMAVQPNTHILKLTDVPHFKGDAEDKDLARSYWEIWEDTLEVNPTAFNTDAMKIRFVLAQMQGGPAAQWATAKRLQARNANPVNWGTWATFKEEFKRAFISPDEGQDARDRLMSIQQTKDVTSYNNEFRMLAQHANINEFNALSQFYKKGLRTGIRRRIMEKIPAPTTMEDTTANNVVTRGLYGLALDMERIAGLVRDEYEKVNPFRRIQQFNQRRDMNQFNRKPVTVLANAVQTGPENRSPTLTPELRQKLSAENRCFKCRIKGHYARNCRTNPFSNTNNPFNNYPRNNGNAREIRSTYTSNSNTSAIQPNNNNPFQQMNSTPDKDSVTNIRKLMADLPVSQFEQLFDSLETEGF